MPLAFDVLGAGDPRLTFVHGFTQTGRSWLPLARELAAAHEVVLVDAPGHGGSADVRAGLADGADLVSEVGGRGVYVGYSMGGRLCLHLALAHPELVRGLVLIGATGGLDTAEERAARRQADEALAADLEAGGVGPFLDRWLAQPLFASLPEEASGREDRLRNTAAGLASSLRLAGTGTQEPLWDRLGSIGAPVLVLAGERDERYCALGRRIAAAIGAHASFTAVEGAGHCAHLERPDVTLRLLRDWLARAVAPAAPGSLTP